MPGKAKMTKGNKVDAWQNADTEFTQLDFSDVSSFNQPSCSYENVELPLHQLTHRPNKRASRFIDPPLTRSSDSRYLCTLLPSRKCYMTDPELNHTVLRNRSLKSEMSNRNATMARRPTFGHAVQYDFPDHEMSNATSEQILSEDDYYEQLMSIKSMAAPMSVKMHYKKQLENSAASLKITKSSKWRHVMNKRRQKMSDFKDEFKQSFNLWHNSFKVIEGQCGTGIVSFFIFIRWLLLLNFVMFVLIFIFIILPQLVFTKVQFDQTNVASSFHLTSNNTFTSSFDEMGVDMFGVLSNASSKYERYVHNVTQTSVKSRIQDFLQGTGWMELTIMFYGAFSPNDLLMGYFNGGYHFYMLPLAYLVVTLIYFAICLIMMTRSIINGSRKNLVIQEAQFYRYFNLCFGSWDFCITDGDSADLKKASLYMEMQVNLKEDEFVSKIKSRTKATKAGIYLNRLVLNLISISILVGAGYLIYYVTIQSLELYQLHSKELNQLVVLLIEFMTPLTITILNIVLPIVFKVLVKFEKYRPDIAISITLFRSVFVRLASLGVLMSTFSRQITCDTKEDKHCVKLLCWETYVGQQLYKLVMLDFFVIVFITLFIETIRSIVVNKFKSFKLIQFIGKPPFDITKHVLNLIYGQTLCWLGVFYCPMLPVIGFIKCIVFFYLLKFSLLKNCKRKMYAYKTTRASTFFTIVTFLTFLLTCIPLVYSFFSYTPSRGCGPFRLNDSIWSEMDHFLMELPAVLQNITSFIFTAGFAVPCFIILCLLMYYYYMLSSAYKELSIVIKEQLKEEGRDKQYLLSRLSQPS